ncbi:MAG: hypothetical protein ABIH21_00570 [Patescibacteria group bacterium]
MDTKTVHFHPCTHTNPCHHGHFCTTSCAGTPNKGNLLWVSERIFSQAHALRVLREDPELSNLYPDEEDRLFRQISGSNLAPEVEPQPERRATAPQWRNTSNTHFAS